MTTWQIGISRRDKAASKRHLNITKLQTLKLGEGHII